MSTENKLSTVDKKTYDVILGRINNLQGEGLQLPGNYSAENALQSAWLTLQETQTMNKQPVLSACSKESIAQAVLKMVIAGLNPMKKQCYFIAYGNKLECQTSYQGNIAIAKRNGLKNVPANTIHEGDDFDYSIDEHGFTKITTHKQTLASKSKPIIGAYAVVNMEDGTCNAEIMTMEDIRKAWAQGATKGNSPAHKNFDGEMCKKTVINRALKSIINTSDDAGLFDDAPKESRTEAHVKHQISEKANKESIGFEEEEEYQEAEHQEVNEEEENQREYEAAMAEEAQSNGQSKGPGF